MGELFRRVGVIPGRSLQFPGMTDLLEATLVYSIVGGFREVYGYFGYGLSESVYAGGLEIELRDRGHRVARELGVEVGYKGRHVCWQRLDMVIDDKVTLELKSPNRDGSAS
jgi:GxxExxY protein